MLQVNLESAPKQLNSRWGGMISHGQHCEVASEKRAWYGDKRHGDAVRGVRDCNCKYDYR